MCNICDSISSITIHSSSEVQEKCKEFFELKDITDSSIIIKEIHSLTVTIKAINEKMVKPSGNSSNNKIESLKKTYPIKSGSDLVGFHRVPLKSGPNSGRKESDQNRVGSDRFFVKDVGFR